MVYLMDNMGCAFQYFWLSFIVTFIMGGIQGAASTMWILFFGFSIVVLHKLFPDFDYGITNTLSKYLAGKAGFEGISLDELLSKGLLQFAGSFVASLIWLEVGADELACAAGSSFCYYHAPTVNNAFRTIDTDSNGIPNGEYTYKKAEIFIHFMLWHYVQLYVFNKLKTRATTLDCNLTTAMAYLMTITLMNSTYIYAIGGLTFDFGRFMAAIIKFDSDTYYTGTWWILLAAPFAGYFLCLGTNMVESMMAKKGDSGDAKADATAEAAGGDNAEENA